MTRPWPGSTPSPQQPMDVVLTADTLQALLPMPATVFAFLAAIDNPRASLREMTVAASHDTGLTAHLLRIANSAAYGMNRQIGNVGEAIRIVGTDQARLLALSWGITRGQQSALVLYDLRRNSFVHHSETVATLTSVIAREFRYPAIGQAYSAGLLHDIGKLVLNSLAGRQGNVLRPLNEIVTLLQCDDVLQAEEACFGTTHAAVGQRIAELWSLPDDLASAIADHHRPAAQDAPLSASVALANSLAANYDLEYPPYQRPPLPEPPPFPLDPLIAIVSGQPTSDH